MAKVAPVIDAYEIEGEAWESAAAAFWTATSDEGQVTISVPKGGTPEDLEVFAYQLVLARKVAEIDGVIRLKESGTTGAAEPFIVYEGVTKTTLGSEIEANGGLDWPEAVRIVSEIGQSVGALHAEEIVHSGLSMETIRLQQSGSPVIADFSSADLGKVHRPGSAEDESQGAQDFSVDVHGLGRLFWAVVQGEEPSSDDEEILAEILAPNCPVAVHEVVAKAMSADPEQRQQSVGEFLEQLAQAASAVDDVEAAMVGDITSETVMFEELEPTGEHTAQSGVAVVEPTGELQVTQGPDTMAPIVVDDHIEVVTAPAAEEAASGVPWFAMAASSIVTALICIGGFMLFSDSLLGRQTIDDFVGMTLTEAELVLEDTSIIIETQLGRADGSEPGDILEQIPRAGTIVDAGSIIRFTVSEGSELRGLPDPSGLTVEEIAAALEAQGFALGEVIEQRDHPSIDRDLGIELVIEGESVDGEYPGGTAFDLVTSTGLVTIPRISQQEIESILVDELGLDVELVEEFSQDLEVGEVIRTEPATGEKVEQGSTVKVVLASDVDPPLVRVPDVVGKTLGDAVNRLRDAGFNPALAASSPGCGLNVLREARERCQNAERGLVWKVEPELVEHFQGSTITLYAPQDVVEDYKNEADDDD